MSRPSDIFPTKDPVKKSLFIPKLLLESTNFWPEKRSFFAKITNWIMLSICVFIEAGQIAFVIANINDITKIASAMSTVSTTFQAISKLCVIYIYSDRLKRVLKIIWFEFWPAHISSFKTFQYLKLYNEIVVMASITMFSSAILFAFGFLSSPLIFGDRVLPFEAVYPFDWSKTPLYEIIYVIEWATNIAFILTGICGHDYLFVGICSNIVGQYILIGEILSNLGTENVNEILEKLTEITKTTKNPSNTKDADLLYVCIKHHIMLKNVAKEVEIIFSFSCFVQLLSSVVALCVAALIMTFAEVDAALFTFVSSYMFGHLLQLFLFCTLGNEVTYHASTLPTNIFGSKWYNIDNVGVKKDLILILAGAQVDVKITAMGIKALDYATFIGVLRLSFSFYTMLSKLTDD